MAEGGQKRNPSTHRTPAQMDRMSKGYNKRTVKQRSARNKARALKEKQLGKKLPSTVDVGHIKPLRSGGSNASSNLRVQSKSSNRADTNPAAGGKASGKAKRKSRSS